MRGAKPLLGVVDAGKETATGKGIELQVMEHPIKER